MKICTHDGRFHCDQVLACTFLRKFTGKFYGAEVVRSRDPQVWASSDIVVDVGGKYEPPRLLDHHQIEFQDTYPGHSVRMSSAGLVYLHYPQIIHNSLKIILEAEKDLPFEPVLNPAVQQEVREKIYSNLIEYVDANDNGVDRVHDKDVAAVPTTLWSRVNRLNPMWWQESADELALFHQAMLVVEQDFLGEVRQAFLGAMQTREMVKTAYNNRLEIHPSGRIVLLDKYVPWQKGLSLAEQEAEKEGQVLFVVFPEKSGLKWRVQAVAKRQGSFQLRQGLRADWRGVKDELKLKALSGLEDIDFCHASGFIGGAVSRASAIKMAEMSFIE